jgi:hypothetical protein
MLIRSNEAFAHDSARNQALAVKRESKGYDHEKHSSLKKALDVALLLFAS